MKKKFICDHAGQFAECTRILFHGDVCGASVPHDYMPNCMIAVPCGDTEPFVAVICVPVETP